MMLRHIHSLCDALRNKPIRRRTAPCEAKNFVLLLRGDIFVLYVGRMDVVEALQSSNAQLQTRVLIARDQVMYEELRQEQFI